MIGPGGGKRASPVCRSASLRHARESAAFAKPRPAARSRWGCANGMDCADQPAALSLGIVGRARKKGLSRRLHTLVDRGRPLNPPAKHDPCVPTRSRPRCEQGAKKTEALRAPVRSFRLRQSCCRPAPTKAGPLDQPIVLPPSEAKTGTAHTDSGAASAHSNTDRPGADIDAWGPGVVAVVIAGVISRAVVI